MKSILKNDGTSGNLQAFAVLIFFFLFPKIELSAQDFSTSVPVLEAITSPRIIQGEVQTPRGIAISQDGTKLFVVSSIGSAVELAQYTLFTPFELISSRFDFSLIRDNGRVLIPLDIALSPDGRKLFVVGQTVEDFQVAGAAVDQYSLGNPYELASITYDDISLDITSLEGTPMGVSFSETGDKMFVVGDDSDQVIQYSLSLNFDLSLVSQDVTTFSVANEDTSPTGITFFPGGMKMQITGDANDRVFEYDLNLPYNISSVAYNDVSLSLTGDNAQTLPQGVVFSPTGDKMFLTGFGSRRISEYTFSTPFDLTTGSAVRTSVQNTYFVENSISASDMTFSNDGMHMFLSSSDDRIYQFDLSSPFDISAIPTSSTSSYLLSGFFSPFAVDFSIDGSEMYVLDGGGVDELSQYTLSTPYDVTTAGFTRMISIPDGETTSPNGITFTDDGTKMFVVGSDEIAQYAVSTAFDISTASFVNTLALGSSVFAPVDVDFNTAGTKMFVTSGNSPSNNRVTQFSLSVPFDVSTATQETFGNNPFDAGAVIGSAPVAVHFSSDASKMYLMGFDTPRRIYEFSLAVAPTIEDQELTVSENFENNQIVGNIIANDIDNDFLQYTITSGNTGNTFAINDGTGDLIVNNQFALDFETTQTYSLTVEVSDGIGSSSATVTVNINDLDEIPVITSGLNGFDLSTAVYAGLGNRRSIFFDDRTPRGLEFNTDGSKMFVVGAESKSIIEYNVGSVPYFVSRASHTGFEEEFSVEDQETFPTDLAFNTDGTKMFVVGSSGGSADNYVIEYNLETGFDVSTAVYAGAEEEFLVSQGSEAPTGIAFDDTGNKMYVAITSNFSNDRIVEYALGTAFDVSTAAISQTLTIDAEEEGPSDIDFSADGMKMFVSGFIDVAIDEYDLEAPFDISGASFSKTLLVNQEEATPSGFKFNNDGTKLFVIGQTGVAVVQYNLAANFSSSEFDEGFILLADIDANNGDGGLTDESITYSLTGTDAAFFGLDITGQLFWRTNVMFPDFEDPQDADANNIYEFTIIVDDGTLQIQQEATVHVLDVDETPPTFTSANTAEIEENRTSLAYTATADEEATFTLGTSNDEAFFVLENDNEISFIDAPDFENPQDSNQDNGYLIEITATDQNGNASSLQVTITVTDVADETPPMFTSPSNASFAENSAGVVYEAVADEQVTFTIESSNDGGLFNLVNENEVFFIELPDFEDPKDSNADNDYLINITAIDLEGNSTTLLVTITVTDVDETNNTAPTISDQTFSVAENAVSATVVGTVSANDADGDALTFSITNGNTGGTFSIDSGTGELSVSTSGTLDFETTPSFSLTMEVNDGRSGIANATVTVNLTDIDEVAPTFTSPSVTSFSENSNSVVYTVTTNESATFSLGTSKDESLFSLSNGNEISFAETPDFENPLDDNEDNVYLIDVIATDLANNSTTLEVAISVTDEDDVLGIVQNDFGYFSVYPNPITNGSVTVDFSKNVKGEISVFSYEGRLVKTISVNGRKTEISLDGEAPGFYLIDFKSQEGNATIRLIKSN